MILSLPELGFPHKVDKSDKSDESAVIPGLREDGKTGKSGVHKDHLWDYFCSTYDLGAPVLKSLALPRIVAARVVVHKELPVCTEES